MAYTICDEVGNPKPLRHILSDPADGENPRLGEWFRPYWWTCDPCAPSQQRYQIAAAPFATEYHAEQFMRALRLNGTPCELEKIEVRRG